MYIQFLSLTAVVSWNRMEDPLTRVRLYQHDKLSSYCCLRALPHGCSNIILLLIIQAIY